jgi:hypothetical protein
MTTFSLASYIRLHSQPEMRIIPRLCAVRPCLIFCLNETHSLGSHFHQYRPGTGVGRVRVPALFLSGLPPYSCQGSRPILIRVPVLFLSGFPPYSRQGSPLILVRVNALFLSGLMPYSCQGSRPIIPGAGTGAGPEAADQAAGAAGESSP